MYMESRKRVLMDLFSGQQWGNRQRTDLWTWSRGRRKRVICMESNMETYITTCKIDSQWEFAV